jgi:hypothetical protein
MSAKVFGFLTVRLIFRLCLSLRSRAEAFLCRRQPERMPVSGCLSTGACGSWEVFLKFFDVRAKSQNQQMALELHARYSELFANNFSLQGGRLHFA